MIPEGRHKPVMVEEVLKCLAPQPGGLIVDATVGLGGHASEILRRITPGGRLIGIDQDREAMKIAEENLKEFSGSFELVYGNFREMPRLLDGLGVGEANGILFDLGISSLQLDTPERGFSFRQKGPLDMRMDSSLGASAYELVNRLDEDSLDEIIRDFGEERFHRRIAREIVRSRKQKRIETTTELAGLILRAIPHTGRQRLHPATRTFQALRIAVNKELDALKDALDIAVRLLRPQGRLCVLSYHSLEDRIVKVAFRKFVKEGALEVLTKKPLRPTQAEIRQNRRASSAKLRAAVRTG